MEAFRFRLGKLLDYRSRLAHEAKILLGAKVQQCNIIRNDILTLQKEQNMVYLNYSTRLTDIDTLRYVENYRMAITQKIEKLVADLQFHETMADKLREQYKLAYQKEKVLEKIKEKKMQEYQIKKQRYQEKILDDILLHKKNADNVASGES